MKYPENETVTTKSHQLTKMYNELFVRYNQVTKELKVSEAKFSMKINVLYQRGNKPDDFGRTDKLVRFYTALPSFSILKTVFDLYSYKRTF